MDLNPSTSIIEPGSQSRTIHLNFPATTRLSNYHMWAMISAQFLFQESGFGVTFIEKSQAAWKPYHSLLEYFHDFVRKQNDFRWLFEDVLSNNDSIDEWIEEGIQMNSLFNYYNNLIRTDVYDFLTESKISQIDKRTKAAFDQWYDGKFEDTSSVHRDAYRYVAQNKTGLSKISVLIMIMPQREKILVTRKIWNGAKPPIEADHKHIWMYDIQAEAPKCYCGVVNYEMMRAY